MEYSKCWLDYRPLESVEEVWLTLIVSCDGLIIESAVKEYVLAMEGLAGRRPKVTADKTSAGVRLLVDEDTVSGADGYRIAGENGGYTICGQSPSGVLYGVFHFLRMAAGGELSQLPVEIVPAMPLRMMNHWDNMDGSIERGYSGESFFYKDYEILWDERLEHYTRMMASIGINGIVINNVNVHEKETYLITDTYLQKVKQYADLFQRYGIKLYTSVNFAAPMELAGFDNWDPLESQVAEWWKETTAHV